MTRFVCFTVRRRQSRQLLLNSDAICSELNLPRLINIERGVFIKFRKFSFRNRRYKTANMAMSANEVRQKFIEFFQKQHDHLYVHSSSTIPLDDPTLLFTNAGMNQFKPLFLGTVDPNSDMAKYKRVCNTQKCIRAGGKHNDLDDVGKDVYHHTFFEMLGNWSFANYFKEEAISMAMELLLTEYKLDKNRLYATYFEGNPKFDLQPDLEAKNLWAKFLPEDHILPGNMKDNFWEMGETGPCGPCSELHFDRIGGGRNAAHLVNKDDPDVLEIWNLVFIQFNRESDGSLKSLPNKHVDTGMGFERITSVIQDKRSNYDTDLFMPIFKAIEAGTGTRPYGGKVGDEDADKIDMAYRVVADHIRTLSIAISDGGRPDNIGRGYVLRRILRRGIRFAIKKLNAKPGFFASLVDTVVLILGNAFPELKKDPQYVKDVINEEEAQFLKTLTRGQKLLEKTIAKLNSKTFPGDVAWRLYDTYGFPTDLTQLICEENGLFINMSQYNEAKQLAQLQSSNSTTDIEDTVLLDVHAIDELKSKFFLYTNDAPKYDYQFSDSASEYVLRPCQATIKAIRFDKQFVDSCKASQKCGLLFDQTSFYAEQGGQIFDEGYATIVTSGSDEDEQLEFIVENVQVRGGFILHIGTLTSSNDESCIKVGDKVILHVDMARRRQIMNNHTATHVLNFGLRKVLNEADQRGSLVAPDRLRFDFTAKGALSIDEVRNVERMCDEVIGRGLDVYAKETPLSVAKAIQGLRAVFDETYPDPVRVVSVGKPIEDLIADPNGPSAFEYSVEFCGGTHLTNSAHMEKLVITSEEAIAKGVRRIIAMTGNEAIKAVKKADLLSKNIDELTNELNETVKSSEKMQLNQSALNRKINNLNDEISQSVTSHVAKDALRKDLQKLKKLLSDIDLKNKAALLSKALDECAKQVEQLKANNTTTHIVQEFNVNGDAKSLNTIQNYFKQHLPSVSLLLFSIDYINEKIVCLSSVPEGQVSKLKANEWLNQITEKINGKGGGRETTAQATGTNITSLNDCLDVASKFAALKLGN